MQIISQGQVSPNKNVSNQDVNLITQERYSRVPEDLKSKNLWCCYSLSENKNDATKKPSKIPKNPQTGQNAKVNDTTTLTDFETAKQAVLSNRYDGLNFAFGQDSELVGIDVDNVLDKDGGFINHSAAAIFDKFKSDGAYIETSPSGTGLRIICRRSDKIFLQFGKGKKFRDFEIYGFEMRRETTMPKLASGLHFLSISGDTLNTSDNLPVCDSVLEDFCRSYIWKSINLDDGSFKSEKKEVEKSDFEESPELSDDKIIEKLRSSKRSVDFDFLFDVGVGSGDNSADDLTLCSMIAFYTQDAAQIENIFNESALVRDKWLDRKNYRDSTIKKAIEGLTTTWQPKINDEGYDWQDKLLENVDEFNKEYANVVIGSKQRIMREFTDGMLEFYQTRDMRDLFANTSIQVGTEGGDEDGSPIYKDKFTAWFKHYESRTYRGGVIFKPAQKVNSDQYNLWKGFMVEPKLGDCSLIKKHIKDVVCSGDEVVSEYLFNWIAYSFQRPEIPIGVAVVLRGEKGCGKGTLGHFLSKIWGIHAFHISNPAHLVGNFNGHLARTIFLFSDEAFFAGDKKHERVLKALITEPVMTIERKGIDCIQQPNFLKIFMATNSDYAIPATSDERRFLVTDVSSTRIGDREYFNQLHKSCNSLDVQAAFLAEMLVRDVSKFHPGDIPETLALKEQRLFSFESHQSWLADFLQAKENTIFQHWVSFAALYENYQKWCESRKVSSFQIVSTQKLSKYLAKIFTSKQANNQRGVFFGSSRFFAVESFEKFERVNITQV